MNGGVLVLGLGPLRIPADSSIGRFSQEMHIPGWRFLCVNDKKPPVRLLPNQFISASDRHCCPASPDSPASQIDLAALHWG